MTRIISGSARGRRLAVPAAGTRPTADRVREALFSALESRLGSFAGTRVLDLYAGSGAFGLEAASRGAAGVNLVERDRTALGVLRANVASVGLPGAYVVSADVQALCASPPSEAPYDVVFADPPYDTPDADVEQLLDDLAAQGWLVEQAVVLVERGRRSTVHWPAGYQEQRERRYGDTLVRHAVWYGRPADPL